MVIEELGENNKEAESKSKVNNVTAGESQDNENINKENQKTHCKPYLTIELGENKRDA